jgi:outer membrane lipoprotein-sorting protein
VTVLASLVALAMVCLAASPRGAAGAACAGSEECLAEVRAAAEGTATMRASFTQVKHTSLLDEPITSRGTLQLRRPDRVRVEVSEPVRTVVVVAGGDLWIPGMSAADESALALAPIASMFQRLMALLAGDVAALERDFDVSARAAAGGGIELELSPRDDGGRHAFRRIDLRFAGTPLVTREVRLEDSLGDRLVITLDDVETGVELPDSLFRRPEGAP